MSTTANIRRRNLAAGAALAAALTLAACGGSDHHDGGPMAGGPGADPTPVDAFIAAVQAQVSMSAETTAEPVSIDSIAVTGSEDKEAIAI
ncbi:MAG: hypothetical protein ACJ8HI_04255 [Massilia sp.]